ncbi:secreted protein containing Na-Ca exchanger/integrin-beta4 domain protein [gut metagenome]|uniref:Secreted protein containing Na-Ca exchanger/integrin-beta4 domain protein n=1 Tax=gut metagenome TaxID=749906 RepID=J9H8C6_9ZZZZ
MRKISYGLMTLLVGLACTAISCGDAEKPTYEGPNYILFSDTLNVLGVQNNEEVFDIPVTATQACNHDRTVAVEVIENKSNAIEGKHYTLENNSVTIKAGERVGNVRIRGIYDEIQRTDSLGLTLRLLTQDVDHWSMYEPNYESKVILQKCCPFDINIFNGYAVLTSTYMQEFMQNVSNRLIKAVPDPENENTIIMKDYFYDGYDVKIRFTTNDILNPLIEMDEQVFAPTADAFGTTYGDGYIHLYQPNSMVSYYSTCEHFIFQYFTLYVPGMAGNNVVGTFANAVEWVSNDEAKKIVLEGSMQISESAKDAKDL